MVGLTKTRSLCSSIINEGIFTYSTVKLVKVPNTYIAVLNRVIQLLVFAYIALYIVWWKRGYQEFQIPNGITITKVKGLTKIESKNNVERLGDEPHQRLWDTAEYEIPPLENNAFFIATRQLITNDQVEGNCPSALRNNLLCTTNATCLKGVNKTDNGYATGLCVESPENSTLSVCEISAWCPEESSGFTLDYSIDHDDLDEFTVYIKSAVTFTKFKKTLRNVRTETNFTCRFNAVTSPRCPIFSIGDILQSIQTDKKALLKNGGLIEIEQKWECNFDFKADRCFPTHEFHLLQSGEEEGQQSPGINYRLGQKYRFNDTDYRTLLKIYGLRFIVTTTGRAGRFDIVNLFVAIGSGIGFMVIAGIVCDFIFMYLHRAKERYRRTKVSICDADYTERTSFANANGHRQQNDTAGTDA